MEGFFGKVYIISNRIRKRVCIRRLQKSANDPL